MLQIGLGEQLAASPAPAVAPTAAHLAEFENF